MFIIISHIFWQHILCIGTLEGSCIHPAGLRAQRPNLSRGDRPSAMASGLSLWLASMMVSLFPEAMDRPVVGLGFLAFSACLDHLLLYEGFPLRALCPVLVATAVGLGPLLCDAVGALTDGRRQLDQWRAKSDPGQSRSGIGAVQTRDSPRCWKGFVSIGSNTQSSWRLMTWSAMTTSHQSKPFDLASTGHRSRGRRAVSVTIDGGYLL